MKMGLADVLAMFLENEKPAYEENTRKKTKGMFNEIGIFLLCRSRTQQKRHR